MSNPFDSAFDPPSPSSLGPSAVTSVQSSLYLRLKKKHGNKAGQLGWLLVRLGQSTHANHAHALEAVMGRSPEEILAFLNIAKATRDAPKASGRTDYAELASSICNELDGLYTQRAGTKPPLGPSLPLTGPGSAAWAAANGMVYVTPERARERRAEIAEGRTALDGVSINTILHLLDAANTAKGGAIPFEKRVRMSDDAAAFVDRLYDAHARGVCDEKSCPACIEGKP